MNAKILAPLTILISAAVLFAASCGKDDPMSPYQPEIANVADNFQFQITAAQNLDHSENYVWRNTGAQATINQSCAITGGTAIVTLSDSTGAQLYQGNLADDGTFQSAVGAPGPWVIRVNFTNLDGTVNFRAQKM
jgi:hypothetical protein